MSRDHIINEYFEWMYDLVCGDRFPEENGYRKLLMQLHNTRFRFSIPMDENRAVAGVELRYSFAYDCGYTSSYVEYLDGPCSVLEMMVALAVHCEEHIMDDPTKGNRTGQWFWSMIVNLNLGSMNDNRFDRKYVEAVIERFLNREYAPDGRGGLFTVKNCDRDLRDVEIFHQMCWYIDTIM